MAEDERAYQRQRKAYHVLHAASRVLMKWLLNFEGEPAPVAEGPLLVLSNHVTDFDPLLVGISFPRHMYFVAGENVMRMGFFSKIIARYASLIQRVKGTTDAEAALQILRTLKKGRSVCMFAEGSRTFTGETLPIAPATAKLVKLARTTLVTYRLKGGYLSTPRWSAHRRKGRMSGGPVGVYSPEELKGMSESEISDLLRRDLYENAYETQKKDPVAYKGKALAETLGEEAAFSDDGQTLNRKEDDHTLTPLGTGTMALYRDRLTVGEYSFPLKELRGIGLIQRQGMVFSTADADYAITASRLRCVRKYHTLFAYLKR